MVRKYFLAALAFMPLTASAAAPQAVYKLEPYRKTVALRAQVGDRQGLFTFDTAGGITLVSPSFAAKIGCKPWGRLSGHRMMGDRLDMPRCDGVPLRLGAQTYRVPVATGHI